MLEQPRRYYAPEHSREPPKKPICSRYDRCKDCPYPSHGFICWSKDEDRCMRTDVQKQIHRKETCK